MTGTRAAARAVMWTQLVLVENMHRWVDVGWREASRERTEVLSLGKLQTLVEFWTDGSPPPRPL